MTLNRITPALQRLASWKPPLKGIFPESQPATNDTSTRSYHRVLFDLLLIVILVLSFCSNFLIFGSKGRLPGLEADVFQVLDWTLVKSLAQGHFPLWNPYLDTGLPYIADPMLHAYNPLISVPVLLFGVWDGFKIALALSFLSAAIGMYALAASLGLSRILRIWLALMFTFAGQPTARFFQGQYLFIFGFAWIPWLLLGYHQVLLTRRKWAAALTVISAALLFFSGNAYYSFLMMISLILFTMIWVININKSKPYLSLDKDLTRVVIVIATVSLLVISIQLLPTLDFLPYVAKASDVEGFHTPYQILLDLNSKDSLRSDAFEMLPAREEFYAYIGFTPILGLLLLPLAWRTHRKWILFLLSVLLFTMSWIGIDRMPWHEWILSQSVIHTFRHLLRALIFTSMAVLLLSALALDRLWRQARQLLNSVPARWYGGTRPAVAWIGLVLFAGFLSYGVIDLYKTNKPIHELWERPQDVYKLMAWFRRYEPDDVYIRNNPNNHAHDAIISNDLLFMEPWYHYTEIRNMRGETRDYFRPLQIKPHYLFAVSADPLPDTLEWTWVGIVEDRWIVSLDESLPMAFTTKISEMTGQGDQEPLTRSSVIEQDLLRKGPNQVETIVRSDGGEILVLLISHYPDWKVYIDGKKGELLNVNGVLGVRVQPGLHEYGFKFRPAWFYIGILLSAIGTFIVAAWLWREIPIISSGVKKVLATKPLKLHLPAWIQGKSAKQRRPRPESELYRAWQQWLHSTTDLSRAILSPISKESGLFLLCLLIYAASRLIALESFPIYFFTDEAVQTILASDLVRDGFYGYDGLFLPTYFENASLYNLSVSVYLQVIPYLLFGKSVFVTRAVPALVTASAALALGLILKRTYKLSYWWTAPLVLGLIPAWFLHSRTAFETTLYVSFTTWACYFYLEYRRNRPWLLLPTILFAALGFYSYVGGQIVLAALGVLLVLIDWPYHRKHPRILVFALIFGTLLVYPYARFRAVHAAETYFHLRRLDSYWYQDLTTWTKALTFIQQYLQGLNPIYWFSRFPDDVPRHLMRGYGRISILALPFFVAGAARVLRGWRDSEHQTLLALTLVTPLGGAIVSVGITRVLLFIIPAAIFITIGLSTALSALKRWLPQAMLISLCFLILAGAQGAMLIDSVKNGATWFDDYGLAGMQYGAQQVFSVAEDLASRASVKQVLISPTWANGTDLLMRFFVPDGGPIAIANADSFLETQQAELLSTTFFILTPAEYQALLENPKVDNIKVDQILEAPNGRPGFYALQFSYADDAVEIFEAEQAERSLIQEEQIQYQGQFITVQYPYSDMGELKHIFDNDPFTLMRFYEANPATIILTFDNPLDLRGVRITTGSMDVGVTCRVQAAGSGQAQEFTRHFTDLPDDPTVVVDFGEIIPNVVSIEIEITALNAGSPFKMHLRDLQLY